MRRVMLLGLLPLIVLVLGDAIAFGQEETVTVPDTATPAGVTAAPADDTETATTDLAVPVEDTATPAETEGPAEEEREEAAAPATDEQGVGIGQIIQWGGPIGYFIISLSVVTVMLIAYHLVTLRKSSLFPAASCNKFTALFSGRKIQEAYQAADADTSLLGRIVGNGLGQLRGGYSEMEQIMNDVAEDEATRLEQGIGYFSLIAAIAPLCGLLGTVVGMILAFNEISIRGVVTPKELAEPIEQALVTTCFGLIVAIPNVVAYTLFRNRLHRLLAELGLVVEELMMPFAKLQAQPTTHSNEFTQAAQSAIGGIEAVIAYRKSHPQAQKKAAAQPSAADKKKGLAEPSAAAKKKGLAGPPIPDSKDGLAGPVEPPKKPKKP